MIATASMDSIFNYIIQSSDIKKYITRVVPSPYKEDMSHHLLLEIAKVNKEKLQTAYNTNTLKYLAFRIVSKQMDPRCGNCFYKIYIEPLPLEGGDRYVFDIKRYKEGDTENRYTIDLISRMDLIQSDDPINSSSDPRLDNIEDVLRHLKPWKVELFNLYYKEELNYRQISEYKNINIKTVQRWVKEIKDEIKKELNN